MSGGDLDAAQPRRVDPLFLRVEAGIEIHAVADLRDRQQRTGRRTAAPHLGRCTPPALFSTCVIPRYFGVGAFSDIHGTIFGVAVLVSGFTAILMGLAFDSNGNYNLALVLIAAALTCSAGLIGVMPSYGSRGLPGASEGETISVRERPGPSIEPATPR